MIGYRGMCSFVLSMVLSLASRGTFMGTQKEDRYTYLLPVNVQPVKDYSVNIFAFTATLLMANMIAPSITQSQVDFHLPRFVLHEWQHFFIYVISFLNVSNYWIAHYSIFENIVQANRTLIRLNVILLLSVTFLPYPSQLMSQYGRHAVVAAFYGITISFTYFMLTVITWYAYSNNRLTRPELHLPVRRIIMLREVIPLIAAVTSTGLAFFFPRLSFLIYFFVSLTFLLPLQLFMKGVEMITPSKSTE